MTSLEGPLRPPTILTVGPSDLLTQVSFRSRHYDAFHTILPVNFLDPQQWQEDLTGNAMGSIYYKPLINTDVGTYSDSLIISGRFIKRRSVLFGQTGEGIVQLSTVSYDPWKAISELTKSQSRFYKPDAIDWPNPLYTIEPSYKPKLIYRITYNSTQKFLQVQLDRDTFYLNEKAGTQQLHLSGYEDAVYVVKHFPELLQLKHTEPEVLNSVKDLTLIDTSASITTNVLKLSKTVLAQIKTL